MYTKWCYKCMCYINKSRGKAKTNNVLVCLYKMSDFFTLSVEGWNVSLWIEHLLKVFDSSSSRTATLMCHIVDYFSPDLFQTSSMRFSLESVQHLIKWNHRLVLFICVVTHYLAVGPTSPIKRCSADPYSTVCILMMQQRVQEMVVESSEKVWLPVETLYLFFALTFKALFTSTVTFFLTRSPQHQFFSVHGE